MAVPLSARAMALDQRRREAYTRSRNRLIEGRDLVAMALANPCEIPSTSGLRTALLGRACYRQDENAMLKRLTNNAIESSDYLISAAANPEDFPMPALSDAWKIMICDIRYLEEGTNLQEAYEAQLREEELQTPAERAREIVRAEEEKIARRNAKWAIAFLERLSPDDLARLELQDGGANMAIWKQISPAPPAFIQQIAEAQLPWGFVYYKTRGAERKYGHKWSEVWDAINDKTAWIPHHSEGERSLFHACLSGIYCRGNRSTLENLWTEEWATGPVAEDLDEDAALRRHFKAYRESISSPGILRNTFIVADDEPIPEDLWFERSSSHSIFWLWAYNADWEPSSTNDATSDGEEYQGRVKVLTHCLNAWFYAARYEEVSLRDMWLKAQNHPQKLWVCYSKPVEEWHHESYT